jgi:hypothetical protein
MGPTNLVLAQWPPISCFFNSRPVRFGAKKGGQTGQVAPCQPTRNMLSKGVVGVIRPSARVGKELLETRFIPRSESAGTSSLAMGHRFFSERCRTTACHH